MAALRRGRAGVDLIAVLALGGTLAVHEFLAGALIALMLATGRTLEASARRRAYHDLRALLEHAPRSARRRTEAGVATIPLAEIAVGGLLVVGPGETVPVDGRVESTAAVLDESVLTGGNPCMSAGLGASRFAVAWSTLGEPSACAPRRPSRTLRTPGSYGWPGRPAPSPRPSYGWPTATRPGSCPCPWQWPGLPGW